MIADLFTENIRTYYIENQTEIAKKIEIEGNSLTLKIIINLVSFWDIFINDIFDVS